MQEDYDTEADEFYVRGPDDLAAWARRFRLGWRPGVVIVHLEELGRFRCLTELPGVSLEDAAADPWWVAGPVAECGCKRVALLVCGSGSTMPTNREIVVIGWLASLFWEAGLALQDVLLVHEHRWRSLRETPESRGLLAVNGPQPRPRPAAL